jgi:hypothetical protein
MPPACDLRRRGHVARPPILRSGASRVAGLDQTPSAGLEPRLWQAGWKAGGPSDRHVGITKGEQRGRDEARRQPAANLVQATTLEDSAIFAVTGLHVDEIAALRRGT